MLEKINKLRILGFTGKTTEEAIFYCDKMINEYCVDCPVSQRSQEEKDAAKKCSEFKNILKEIKSEIKISGKNIKNINVEPYYQIV
jgi:hypothetical protein